MLDELGGPETYNHYPNGWAMAFNTPFKMWKRYEYDGGTSDPCIISWPEGISRAASCASSTTTRSTSSRRSSTCSASSRPTTIGGHVQTPFDGVSMRYSFDSAPLPSARQTQFYSMLGSRSIWHEGWNAVTTHPTISGWGSYETDTWELYHTDVDRSECHDLAAEHPERLQRLINLWYAEAGANGAFPLDDRSPLEIILTPRPQLSAPRNRYVYYPDLRRGAGVPGGQRPQPLLRDRRAGRHPRTRREGVLFAHGSRFGGHASTSRTTACTTSTASSAASSRRSSPTQDAARPART